MVAVSKKLEPNNDACIVLTNPPFDFVINPDDSIIILER